MNLNFNRHSIDYLGNRIKSAFPTPEFWGLWRTNKESMVMSGIFLSTTTENGKKLWLVNKSEVEQTESSVKRPAYKLTNPSIIRKLKPEQLTPVGDLLVCQLENKLSIDASNTGVGKTYQALGMCTEIGYRPFIVCPKSAVSVWRGVCEHFGVKPLGICNYEYLRGKNQNCITHKKVIRDYNGKKYESHYCEWKIPKEKTLIIFDEVHKCKTDNTINSRMLLAAKGSYNLHLVSATPFDKIKHFRTIGVMCDFFTYTNFKDWAKSQGAFEDEYRSITALDEKDIIEQISKKIFPQFGVRIKKSEVKGFPELQNSAVCVEVDNSPQITQEIGLLLDQIRELKDKNQKLPLILRYRQLAEILKVKSMVALTKEYLEKGCQVALFVNFDETVKQLLTTLKTDCAYTGAYTTAKQKEKREQNLKDFQSGKSKVMVLNIQAGGASISLHDLHGGSERVSLISPPQSAQDLKQCLGRICRVGGKSFCQNIILFGKNTIEEKVYKKVLKVLENIDTLVDNDLDPIMEN
jgi:superfamily II DNA or RNA helicase